MRIEFRPLNIIAAALLAVSGLGTPSQAIASGAVPDVVQQSPSMAGVSFRDGDLIFQQSRSDQSRAIEEASASPWTHVGLLFRQKGSWWVSEAIGPVVLTRLEDFLVRGRNRRVSIRRFPELNSEQLRKIQAQAQKWVRIPYDVYFEWSDERIYCSEMIFKAYEAAGIRLAEPERVRDLKMDGPEVRRLIIERYQSIGKRLNFDEPIVTPALLHRSERLETIWEN